MAGLFNLQGEGAPEAVTQPKRSHRAKPPRAEATPVAKPPKPRPQRAAAPAAPPSDPKPAPEAPAKPPAKDAWGDAATAHSAAKAKAKPAASAAKSDTAEKAKSDTPSRSNPERYGPWPENGKKYPFLMDYTGFPDPTRYNQWFDEFAPDGLAASTKVGEALYATQIYYEASLDIHPLVQLATVGLFFGGGWAKEALKERKQRKQNAPAEDPTAKAVREAMAKAEGK